MRKFLFLFLVLLFPTISFASSLDLCPIGARIEDYSGYWRGPSWEITISDYGDMAMTRYSDYHYRGRSDYSFALSREYSSPAGYALSGRYTVSGKDGTFRGFSSFYFCSPYDKRTLCGHYRVDGGAQTRWETFYRY